MRADPEEHLIEPSRPSRSPLRLLGALLILGIIGVLAYWYLSGYQDMAEPALLIDAPSPPQPPRRDTLAPVPDIPRREAIAPEASLATTQSDAIKDDQQRLTQSQADMTALSLGAGEARVRDFANGQGAALGLKKLADNAHPVTTSAALIDGASRGLILRKVLPLTPPSQAFSVSGEGSLLFMAPDSYTRYDDFAAVVASLSTDDVANDFHRLRHVYEMAYDELGLDADNFDNAVIRALDLVLATPEITEPIALQRRSVVYIYADPALENLPPLQKQLLRMGPENIRLIKQAARALRNTLLPPPDH